MHLPVAKLLLELMTREAVLSLNQVRTSLVNGLSAYLPVCLSAGLSLCLSVCLSHYHQSIFIIFSFEIQYVFVLNILASCGAVLSHQRGKSVLEEWGNEEDRDDFDGEDVEDGDEKEALEAHIQTLFADLK